VFKLKNIWTLSKVICGEMLTALLKVSILENVRKFISNVICVTEETFPIISFNNAMNYRECQGSLWRVLLPCFAASANQYYILRQYTKRGKSEVDIEGTTDNTKRKKGQKPIWTTCYIEN
jgi:hypothetical protein